MTVAFPMVGVVLKFAVLLVPAMMFRMVIRSLLSDTPRCHVHHPRSVTGDFIAIHELTAPQSHVGCAMIRVHRHVAGAATVGVVFSIPEGRVHGTQEFPWTHYLYIDLVQ
ncbi:uncharacterized protein YALI1_B02021g [Yarrowia lipolytica]|uniref:Uncharacterized protein n=1 Tax=Yarrowia lipolytica TaxID=4952 RepID=A0A1D8N5Z6_YARLL|nr:hypothetical protein YALI1_B02021g [Yarrowia lipolytica]